MNYYGLPEPPPKRSRWQRRGADSIRYGSKPRDSKRSRRGRAKAAKQARKANR